MTESYARASGEPGVVLVTSVPGATKVNTPMQDAMSHDPDHPADRSRLRYRQRRFPGSRHTQHISCLLEVELSCAQYRWSSNTHSKSVHDCHLWQTRAGG
jgi:hypothetical protein